MQMFPLTINLALQTPRKVHVLVATPGLQTLPHVDVQSVEVPQVTVVKNLIIQIDAVCEGEALIIVGKSVVLVPLVIGTQLMSPMLLFQNDLTIVVDDSLLIEGRGVELDLLLYISHILQRLILRYQCLARVYTGALLLRVHLVLKELLDLYHIVEAQRVHEVVILVALHDVVVDDCELILVLTIISFLQIIILALQMVLLLAAHSARIYLPYIQHGGGSFLYI